MDKITIEREAMLADYMLIRKADDEARMTPHPCSRDRGGFFTFFSTRRNHAKASI